MMVKAAIVQAAPIYYDLAASLDKAQTLITEAAQQGAQLVVLGETWLPGYPAWLDYCSDVALWDHEPTKAVFAHLYANSVTIPGPELDALAKLAHQLQVVIIIGVNEKVLTGPGNGTLFNSLITLDTTGKIANHHRKLRPTYTERLVWGPGDSRGLQAVPTALGRIGGLVCWEHWMPLARQALHLSNEAIHIAAWPAVKEMHQIASRHYAFEGRCFVLAAGSLMSAIDLPPAFEAPSALCPNDLLLNGGSAIIGPDGQYITGPCFDTETIITAELNLTQIVKERMTLDVTGHYARDDVFEFQVRMPD